VLWVYFLIATFLVIGMRARRAGAGRTAVIILVSAATMAIVYIQFPPS
jgi:hypothetical protein